MMINMKMILMSFKPTDRPNRKPWIKDGKVIKETIQDMISPIIKHMSPVFNFFSIKLHSILNILSTMILTEREESNLSNLCKVFIDKEG